MILCILIVDRQPSSYMDELLEELKVLSLPKLKLLKADHGLVQVDHSNPHNNDTRLSNGSVQITKKVAKTSPKHNQAKRKFVILLAISQRG